MISLRNQKDTLKELAELQQLAERRKVKCERELHGYYVPDPGHSNKKESSHKTVYLIPNGLEKPPLRVEVSMVVPSWEQTAYNRQNQWLWDQLVSGHCSADLIRLILRPTKRGYYNDVPVIGEEGNGVLALWALMMHFRKCLTSISVMGGCL